MADTRINALATTATSTAADDYFAIDGTTNATRKMSAHNPVFSNGVTAPSLTSPALTNLSLISGSSGATAVFGQGANGDVTLTPKGSGMVAISGGNARVGGFNTGSEYGIIYTPGDAGTYMWQANLSTTTGITWGEGTLIGTTPKMRLAVTTGNLLIGGTADITGSGGLKVFGTTDATNSTSGAVQIAGGAGIAKALFVGGAITTGAPNTGTAGAWKLGIKVDATTTLDTAKYLQVDVGGTLYKVALVTSS